MKPGFYIIMAAQFCSALADNALLIASIAMLRDMQAPPGYEPLLKTFFTLSFVLLAAFVGAFADSMAKRHVMFISNGIKIAGCLMMLAGLHPLAAYAVVGLGAAAYSPAKYGIVTEYVPHRLLVVANAWIEGLTVVAIILGTMVGGAIINPRIAQTLLSFDMPLIDTGIETIAQMNLVVVSLVYVVAAIFNLYIPDTGVDHRPLRRNPLFLLQEFGHCARLLWRDKLGQISLAVTTLFWGVGATLQFIVLMWARQSLGLDLTKASMMQGVFAVGVAVGAVIAARTISLRGTVKVIPVGMSMGLLVMAMIFIHSMVLAVPLLLLIGALSGLFVVPMNALLQHRGQVLMGAGHSIAVQNFNENLSMLIMTSLYAALLGLHLPVQAIIVLFGLFVTTAMFVVRQRHVHNQSLRDDLGLLDDLPH